MTIIKTQNTVTADVFRSGMRQLVGGVTVISATSQDGPVGLTATAIVSVSDTPPTLLCCINKNSPTLPAIDRTRSFCVNLLSAEDQGLARRFAGMEGVSGSKRFVGDRWTLADNGAPRLEDAICVFECILEQGEDVGSHRVLFGSVRGVHTAETGAPLIYASGQFCQATPLINKENNT